MKQIGFIGLGLMGKPEAVFRASADEIDESLNASTIAP
jgi:3-hydroxyisobutyrate dehydrogenase-like beta-hydroxyacid dehydrogenase